MFGGCYLLPIGCWPPQIVSHWSPTHSNEAIIKVIYLIQIVCNDKYFSALHVIMFGCHILFSLVVGSHKLSLISLQYCTVQNVLFFRPKWVKFCSVLSELYNSQMTKKEDDRGGGSVEPGIARATCKVFTEDSAHIFRSYLVDF